MSARLARYGLLALVIAVQLAPRALAAQRRRPRARAATVGAAPSIGVRVGYDFDADHVFLGPQLDIPVARRLALQPSADFYLGVAGTPIRFNVDLKYHPATSFGLFYFGGGLAILHASGNTDTGGNIFAGWEGRRLYPFRPFLEARLVIASSSSFNLLGGLSFAL